MENTKETFQKGLDPATKPIGACRFIIGDRVFTPLRDYPLEIAKITWDAEFGGWLLSVGGLLIHEQNFIHEDEQDMWQPHQDGLWSFWTMD